MKTKKVAKDKELTKLPFFGYFFRKIQENRQAIETALKTGKETSKIKKKSFMGIINFSSIKIFRPLKLKRKK